jgi:hypothetical protein
MSVTPGKDALAPAPISRLFLVGCQRSGTTVLQAAAGRLPGVLTMPETNWFPVLLGGLDEWVLRREDYVRAKWRRRLALASPRTYSRLRSNLGALEAGGASRLRRRLRGSAYIEEVLRLLDTAARRQDCQCWLEKTPDHYAYIEIIARYIPDARFVHLVRNCEDVIASAVDGQMRYADSQTFHGSIPFWVERWLRAAETHLHYAGRPGHLVLCYEDFVAAPQEQLELLRRFAGLPPGGKPRPAQHIADLEREPWKESAVNQPVRPPERKFEALFGPRLRDWLRQRLPDYEALRAELRRRQQPRLAAILAEAAPALRQLPGIDAGLLAAEPAQ